MPVINAINFQQWYENWNSFTYTIDCGWLYDWQICYQFRIAYKGYCGR